MVIKHTNCDKLDFVDSLEESICHYSCLFHMNKDSIPDWKN